MTSKYDENRIWNKNRWLATANHPVLDQKIKRGVERIWTCKIWVKKEETNQITAATHFVANFLTGVWLWHLVSMLQ
jgi:hypothetical protein